MNSVSAQISREPLSRDAIVAAAMAIADEDGVGALSMRNLARRLQYEVMSLYNHVANKDDLLSLMVDSVATEIRSPTPDAGPLTAVREIVISTHEVLVRHPWAPNLWLRHIPGPARTRIMDDLLRLLYASGLSDDLAHHGFHAVSNHVLGYTMQELGMARDEDDAEAINQRVPLSNGSRDVPTHGRPRSPASKRRHIEQLRIGP